MVLVLRIQAAPGRSNPVEFRKTPCRVDSAAANHAWEV